MAALLVDSANRPEDFAVVERHLQAARSDPAAAATQHYAQGVLALRRRQGAEAVRELKQALALDPTADLPWYKLALAQAVAGDRAGSEQTMAAYQHRHETKRLQAEALGDISQHPDRPEGYLRAARLFESEGLKEQAQALLQEGRRRCGRKAFP